MILKKDLRIALNAHVDPGLTLCHLPGNNFIFCNEWMETALVLEFDFHSFNIKIRQMDQYNKVRWPIQ